MHAIPCPRHGCRFLVEPMVLPGGKVVFNCPKCERHKQGLCVDCPAPPARPQALRCSACSRRHELVSMKERTRRRRGSKPRHPRNEAGLCVECPAPLSNSRADRCKECARRRARKQSHAYAKRKYRTDAAFRRKTCDRAMARLRRDPVAYQRHLESCRNRRRGPMTKIDLQKAYITRARRLADPAYRERHNRRCVEVATAKRKAIAAGLSKSEWRRFDEGRHLLKALREQALAA